MTTLSWRSLKLIQIDAKPEGIWNIALEYLASSRLVRIRVVDANDAGAAVPRTWSPVGGVSCGPNGMSPSVVRPVLWAQAPYASLIAKVGGSTADLPSKEGTFEGKKVFAVGSYVVFTLDTNGGPLFLTMNDTVDEFYQHSGSLWVNIEECPL
jgi:hypothetical protein